MKKKVVWAGVALVVLQLLGVLTAARDYGTIGAKYLTTWFKNSLPVVVDIERLELSLQQLDAEIASNGRQVVEQSVALDRYAEQVSAKERTLAAAKNDLKVLRTKFVSLDDPAAKKPIEDAMAARLARCKVQSQTLESTRAALSNKRHAYEAMVAAFEKQKVDRDILKEKLESFRAEYETMKMRGELEQTAIANSASRKASDLAIEIADRLEVQRRLAAIESTSIGDTLVRENAAAVPAVDLSEVDQILNGETACGSQQLATH